MPSEPKRKPMGKAIEWSDEDLERLAEITPEDIEAAKALVEGSSPLLAKLMDAKEVDENANTDQSPNA